MKKLSLFLITFLAALSLTGSVFAADLVKDAQCSSSACVTCCDPASPTCNNSDPTKCGGADCSKQSNNDPILCAKPCSKDNGCDLVAKYVNPFIKFLGILVGLAVTIGIIWGGIEYSSSGGDPQRAASGRRHITVAVIGLVSYFFIYALIHFLMPSGT
jgi:hypothetical protein